MGRRLVTDIDSLKRLNNAIGQGCLTNSKHPDRFVKGVYPIAARNAKGAYIKGVNGREYIDYICGLGTCLFGYAHRDIINSANNELLKGFSMSLPTETELDAAERLKALFPFIEKVKYLKTGTEAAMAAIRIARAHTNRKFILSEGYHGWSDEFTVLTPPANGVCESLYSKKLTGIDQINDMVAAVIIEPVELNSSIERIRWLQALRERCTNTGTVLIFDEIITGFRYKDLSVSNHLNIRPDLILLGKAMAGGLPLSAIGGSSSLLDGDYFCSSTFAGENVSLASHIKTMELLTSGGFSLNNLWENGQEFIDKFNSIWPEKIWIEGYSVRGVFKGDPEIIALFWQEAVDAGILFGPSWFYSFAHPEHQYRMLEIIKNILGLIRLKKPTLRGMMPTSPFSSRARYDANTIRENS